MADFQSGAMTPALGRPLANLSQWWSLHFSHPVLSQSVCGTSPETGIGGGMGDNPVGTSDLQGGSVGYLWASGSISSFLKDKLREAAFLCE